MPILIYNQPQFLWDRWYQLQMKIHLRKIVNQKLTQRKIKNNLTDYKDFY